MHQFSKGVLLFLLTCFFYTVSGRIVPDFSECNHFFYRGIPPTGLSEGAYQSICQQYKNRYRFATLYSTISHAPLYSAYKVSPSDIARPSDEWMYEPQLENDPEMQITYIKAQYKNQASLEDYRQGVYTKGHLAPCNHLETQEDKEATFTLTNIVPQREGSNSGTWNDWEEEILEIKKKYCTGVMYVITGGIPFTPAPEMMNEKVSVPEYMWSAYCCTDFQDTPTDMNDRFPSYAAVGRNHPESPEDIVKKDPNLPNNKLGYDVEKKTLHQLHEILRKKLNMEITLFDGDCQTVQF